MESESKEDGYPRSRIVPDGIVEVIFHYGEPCTTYQDDVGFLQPKSFAISMMKKYVEIESTGNTGFISVRFFPWGAYHFFDTPIQEFLDQTIDATKLWGDRVNIALKRLKETPDLNLKFLIVEQFLLDSLQEHKKPDTIVEEALKLIRDTKGILPIEKLCEHTGESRKQLERKFLSTIGTTPKVFSRITRFLNICHQLGEHKDKTLTQLTHECGYYDQAHFIKEFKEFSGFTPKEYFTKENFYFSEI
jgi:AraC-like DNA-binding protein